MSQERSVKDVSGLYMKGSGGEGGIRTLDTGVSPYNGLANRRLQPLGHLSAASFQQFNTCPSIHLLDYCWTPLQHIHRRLQALHRLRRLSSPRSSTHPASGTSWPCSMPSGNSTGMKTS